MVTFNKERNCPDLSILEYARPETACTTLTDLGLILQEQIEVTSHFSPEIRIHDYMIMPDHVHILIQVKESMQRHLGEVIQAIKAASTSRMRKYLGNQNLNIFEDGFNDRIIFDKKQFETVRHYIHDNPHPLAIRRDNPDYFRRINSMNIDGYECQAYGNLQLLDNLSKNRLSCIVPTTKQNAGETANVGSIPQPTVESLFRLSSLLLKKLSVKRPKNVVEILSSSPMTLWVNVTSLPARF